LEIVIAREPLPAGRQGSTLAFYLVFLKSVSDMFFINKALMPHAKGNHTGIT
jgi:hypothetical protein